jgi:Cof subfamily protein (haloacid dehalogenase superfamily)
MRQMVDATEQRRAGLVALDVDGTLLEPDSSLPPARGAALEALVRAGIPVVIVTGKTWPSVRDLWQRWGLQGPHVCCNGSAVVDADERLLSVAALPPATVDRITAELLDRDIAYAAYLDDGTSVTARSHPGLAAIEAVGEAPPVVAEPGDRRVLKVLSVLGEEDEDGLRELPAQGAKVQRTGPHFLEWNPAHVDKGTGLAHVAELLGVPLDRTVAVGDAESDLPMFVVAGTSVAVAAAAPAAVAAADLHLAGRDLTHYLLELVR